MKVIDGKLTANGLKFVIVKSRENSFLTSHLLDGAVEAFKMHGGNDNDLTVINVPTNASFCHVINPIQDADAIICLGADEQEADRRYLDSLHKIAANKYRTPIIIGIADGNLEDLVNKCGVKAGNLGAKSVEQAIELVNVLKQVS